MTIEKIKIAVMVSGGVVQAVACDQLDKVNLVVVDMDDVKELADSPDEYGGTAFEDGTSVSDWMYDVETNSDAWLM